MICLALKVACAYVHVCVRFLANWLGSILLINYWSYFVEFCTDAAAILIIYGSDQNKKIKLRD